MTAGETHRAIEAIFRIERARLTAGLARVVRNVDRAEELAQGVPANPGAWLNEPFSSRGRTPATTGTEYDADAR